jgi:hypothetical protein
MEDMVSRVPMTFVVDESMHSNAKRITGQSLLSSFAQRGKQSQKEQAHGTRSSVKLMFSFIPKE